MTSVSRAAYALDHLAGAVADRAGLAVMLACAVAMAAEILAGAGRAGGGFVPRCHVFRSARHLAWPLPDHVEVPGHDRNRSARHDAQRRSVAAGGIIAVKRHCLLVRHQLLAAIFAIEVGARP